MSILVTGGAGFVGRHLVSALLGSGDQVVVLDLAPMPAGFEHAPRLRVEAGSVLDAAVVDALVRESGVVVHLAGIAEPLRYGASPVETMETNLLGSMNVVRSAARRRVPVLFASTSEVYGHNPDLPWSEDAARVYGPIREVRWCYAAAKSAVEHYLHACHRELGLSFVTVRLFNVYGPGLRGRAVATFIERALDGAPLPIFGDGRQARCFCYVDDVVDALSRIVHRPIRGSATYNVGSPTRTTVLDLARLIRELTGSDSPIHHVAHEDVYEGYADVRDRVPCLDRILRDHGWRPTTDLRAGLDRTIMAEGASRRAASREDER